MESELDNIKFYVQDMTYPDVEEEMMAALYSLFSISPRSHRLRNSVLETQSKTLHVKYGVGMATYLHINM